MCVGVYGGWSCWVAQVGAEHLGYLAGVEMFRHLSPDQLRVLLGHTSMADFARGQAVVRQGEPGDAFFVIVRSAAPARLEKERV